MKQLRAELDRLLRNTRGDQKTINAILNSKALYPFSVEGQLLEYFLSIEEITYPQYAQLKDDYIQRNQYLELFDMAPRTYGQTWGEQHIRSLFPQFMKATKENLAGAYPDFDGEFDLWYNGIRVEVKACRANSTRTGGSLSSRAFLHSEAYNTGFKYHYQQLKPSCCDVFIWIGTCRDELLYWVLSSQDLLNTGKLGSQHRNEHTGVVGAEVFEGQVFMTEQELAPFAVNEADILRAVCEKGQQ